ncbi:MAG: PRD domain-containing protein [Clostridium sp.]|uniref:PtsGHI operon antiterminator n=1 Tax=Clostridium paraputrificum TaxID=29363 RepID=A0A6N3EP79_9CLOT|nr:PRD domain-containing protein [Clostridium sp.]MBS5927251.1 PRD domain-containing protein [Clostridium sp.]MBS5987889.1 PRD domain-containing protein [Clostridium sp.]
MILNNDEIVTKIFNNNIILVNSEDKEKILFAKGIGFGKKPGYVIPKGIKVDKIFTIADSDNIENLNTMIEKVDNDFFVVCEEAIYEISEKINQELNESIHIGLIDHLYFAIKRLKNNEEIENPFLVEIETLYSKEYMLADMVAKKVGAYCNVDIPDGEIAFIALHIHSAINNGKISNTLKNSYLGSTIVEHVEDRLNIEIDRKSLDYARFLTHIKFAIQRIMENININNELTKIIKSSYKESFSIAEEVAEIIEDELGIKVMEDEVTFLTIHIERFRMSIR